MRIKLKTNYFQIIEDEFTLLLPAAYQKRTFADEELHCTEMSGPRCLHQGRPPPLRFMFLEEKGEDVLLSVLVWPNVKHKN